MTIPLLHTVLALLCVWFVVHRQSGHQGQSQLSKRRRQEAWSVDRSTSFAQVCLPSLVTQMQMPASTDQETALQVETGNIPTNNLAITITSLICIVLALLFVCV